MYQINNNLNMLHFDLNMTQACNMACDYCFEEKNVKSFEDTSLFISKMNDVLKSEYFKKNYDLLNINFWGGEPTLEYEKIEEIIRSFEKNDSIRFFIFSNGYDLKGILPVLTRYSEKTVKGNHPKICIQISYDGGIVHDIHRLDHKGNKTSNRVIQNIKILNELKIPYVVKSVIHPNNFDKMIHSYHDIKKLTYDDDPKFFKSQNYHPTIEYHNNDNVSIEDVSKNIMKLKTSLTMLVAEEIVAIKDKGHRPFFSWLYKNVALCSAGGDYFAIDVDSTIYPCHGCLYLDNKEIHEISTLYSPSFIEDLEKSARVFKNDFQYLPDECKRCETSFCMKCNVIKFERSNKEDYINRWRDYTNQPILCKYFKEIGKYSKAFQRKVGRK